MVLDFLWNLVSQQTFRKLPALPDATWQLVTGAICTLVAIVTGVVILRRHGNILRGRGRQRKLTSTDLLLKRAEEEEALLELLRPQQFDPLECLVHIQGKLKKKLNQEAKRHLETGVAANRISGEATVEREQLDAIYRLIERRDANFDSQDFEEQQKLYME